MRFAVVLPALALALCGCGEDGVAVPAVGTLERDRIELLAETDDPIVEILVTEGDAVEAGDVLLRMEATQLSARTAQARALRDEAAARVAEAVRGPRRERIEEARAGLEGARSEAAVADRELERIRQLAQANAESRSRLDALQAAADAARARRQQARAALDALLEGTTVEELDQARSALAAAEAALADVLVRFGRLTVQAPRAGRIDALPYERGERPRPGAVVAVLLADEAPYARVYIPQPLRVHLAPGALAEVEVAGLEGRFAGRLRWVSHDAAFTPYFALTRHDRGHLSYLAEVDLVDERARELPTGVPVEVRFDAAVFANAP